jgi:hypothetical protein
MLVHCDGHYIQEECFVLDKIEEKVFSKHLCPNSLQLCSDMASSETLVFLPFHNQNLGFGLGFKVILAHCVALLG